MSTPDALISSESNEWYTPAWILDAARRALGGIDLDPASNAIANQTVRAAHYFTASDNGLAQPWRGRVFLNPPYGKTNGKSNQGVWSSALLRHYRAGTVTAAILLVNAVPGERWFQPLFDYPICFLAGRVKFVPPPGSARKGSPTHGTALIYFGRDADRFSTVFSTFGNVMVRQERRADEAAVGVQQLGLWEQREARTG